MNWTVGGTFVKSSRSVYSPHLLQTVLAFIQSQRGWQCSLDFLRTIWSWRRFSESYAAQISVKISRICEFRVIMGIMTGLLGCCPSSTIGSRANDYVLTLATLGCWLHHSPCSLGCWTSNTLAARSLSPKQCCAHAFKSGSRCDNPKNVRQMRSCHLCTLIQIHYGINLKQRS